MNETAQKILLEYSFAITKARLAVLNIFLNSNEALNLRIVEKEVGETVNRATVYRILRGFSESGLLNVVPSTDGTMRYALNLQSPYTTVRNNTHFLCIKCGKIYSLTEEPLLKIVIPESYKAEGVEVLIKGVCADCHE